MTKQAEFGVNVWWTLPETSVDGIIAQSILKKHGFETEDMKLPSRQLEVSRTVKSFHNRRRKDDRRLGEKVSENDKEVVYGILDREQQTGSELVSFEQHTTVKLDKVNGTVTVGGTLKDAFDKALPEFQGKITDQDVRYFLRKVIRMCYGISKRPTGGIYFVPAKFASVIEQAQAVLAEFNGQARIYVERVMDGIQERKNVWDSVEAEVEGRLVEAVSAIGRIERKISAVKGQKDNIEEAAELMRVYQALLGEEAKYEGLAEKIEDAVKMVSEKMAEIQTQTKAPAKAPATSTTANQAKGKTTVAEASYQVLSKNRRAMSYREIMDEAVKDGLYAPNCEGNPYSSFNGCILRAVKMGESRFEKVGRGVFQLV